MSDPNDVQSAAPMTDAPTPAARGTQATAPAPSEIRLSKDRRTLAVSWTGESVSIPAELLRVESPSAEVQGHDPSQKQLVSGKREVEIIGIEPVGNYAVRLRFDDLHSTGIYSWGLLRAMGREAEPMMARYDAAVRTAGRSRERGG